MVVELMAGSLFDRIGVEPREPFAQSLQYLVDVAEGLRFLHGKNILHRDLKPGNILGTAGRAKKADVGLTRTLHGSQGADVSHGFDPVPRYALFYTAREPTSRNSIRRETGCVFSRSGDAVAACGTTTIPN